MTPPRTLVVVNPAAGGGRALRRWRRLEAIARAAFPFEEVHTAAPGEATQLVRDAVSRGYERILAVGGDGTLHEVVNGAAGTSVAVGLLPLGTGNDFARSAGLLRPARHLLPALVHGRRRVVDLGRVHGRYYLNVAGVGFDAEVAREVNQMDRKGGGTVPYLLTAVRAAFRYEPPVLSLTADDHTLADGRRLLVAVGNAAAYGGGMRICPHARLDDGLLDVLIVGDIRGWSTLRLLPKVFTGTHLGHPLVAYRRVRQLRVTGPTSAALHADGELVGGLPATFDVAPGALVLWIPA